MYKWLIRPTLFLFDPEKVHYFTTSLLKTSLKIPVLSALIKAHYRFEDSRLQKDIFGIIFKNPVGLAAGFDKNAEFYKEMYAIGFGFIEIGTVTPLAQDGNPKKRLFRLKEDKAIGPQQVTPRMVKILTWISLRRVLEIFRGLYSRELEMPMSWQTIAVVLMPRKAQIEDLTQA